MLFPAAGGFAYVEFSFIAFLTALAMVLLIAGVFSKYYYLVLGASFLLVITSLFFFAPTPGFGVGLLTDVNTTVDLSSDTSQGALTTVPHYDYTRNNYIVGLGVLYAIVGLAMAWVTVGAIGDARREAAEQN